MFSESASTFPVSADRDMNELKKKWKSKKERDYELQELSVGRKCFIELYTFWSTTSTGTLPELLISFDH